MGCGAWAAVVLMLILLGFLGFSAWLSAELGCPGYTSRRIGPDRAAKDLEEAVAQMPGVAAVEAEFTLGGCTWYDSLAVDLTVRADADPEQVAAAVAQVAAGMRPPETNPSGTRARVHDDVPEQHPGAGPLLILQKGDPDRAAAVARAWAQLKGRYRGVHVAVEHGRESIGVQLPGSPDPAAVREAFDVLRGLGLTEGADAQLRWYVVVAGQERASRSRERSYFVEEGDLPPAEGLAAIEAVAAWSAALGPEVVHRSKAVWIHREGDESPGLEVEADVDIRTAGRTADELADELAGRLAGSGVPYRVGVFDVNRLGEAVRASS
jgi:hypothetical protein